MPRFKALAEHLEDLKNRHEQGQLLSIDFLKELLRLAEDVVNTERNLDPIEDEDRGKMALTELFEEAKNGDTPIMVERVVNDIDEIVKLIRFDGWQNTHAGEREAKMAPARHCSSKSCIRTRICLRGRTAIFGRTTNR